MRETAFVICEYDPFHNGHFYHLLRTREAGAKYIVCLMSGNFVQRGDMAFCDKTTRAAFAVAHGADVVIELPVKYVLSGARWFAEGAAGIIKAANVPGTLSFGAGADLATIKTLADFVKDPQTETAVNEYARSSGANHAMAVQKTAERLHPVCAEALGDPNNVLAAEYINACERMGLSTDFFAVKREAPHDAPMGDGDFASAKSLRDMVYTENDWGRLRPYVPADVFEQLITKRDAGALPTEKRLFSAAVTARLLDKNADALLRVNGVNQGIENRILEALKTAGDLYAAYDKVKTKRFTHARIRQIMLSAALGIEKETLPVPPAYYRVLAVSEAGRETVKALRANAATPFVMNLSEAPEGRDRALDALCGRLFDLCRPVPPEKPSEFAAKPYVAG